MQPMFPFVDPRWYENYWYSNRPRPKRRSFSRSLARFAVLVGLLVGGSLVLKHSHFGVQVAVRTGNTNEPVLNGGAAVRPPPVILE